LEISERRSVEQVSQMNSEAEVSFPDIEKSAVGFIL